MKEPSFTLKLLTLALLPFNFASHASDAGRDLFNQSCVACHSVQDNSNISLSQRLEEKAPTLFYAGNKFNAQWLQKWLVAPSNIRSGGHFFLNRVKVTDDGDVIDESAVPQHPAVNAEQAKLLTSYLMQQRPKSELLAREHMTPGKISKTLGDNDFHKFKGCGACHQGGDAYGGVSGPELYTAIDRLQPEYISSYIRSPELWDPKTLMPNRHLNDSSIKKLLDYLNTISLNTQ
ncbi:c-type cytochrome [Shewanella salipaludis]|uniref:Cytochrome c n=1 Tax=Shewanella salipaludis TaxID=2723052 RepID=A0A972JKX3_9GAMM|nr:c-type cytochrome [Shewanella salipaludis]NMH66650.1 cytochrome c [Shewanella salipaludis]